MRKAICSAFLLAILCLSAFGQDSRNQPKLLGSFDANSEDVLNAIDKVGMALEGTFDREGDTFAVRVCSNEPLRIALALSAASPFLTVQRLQSLFKIPISRTYYLRQNIHCNPRSSYYVLTEYWYVPKQSEFPEFVEAVKASDISGYEITHAGLFASKPPFDVRSNKSEALSPELYESALRRAVERMKEDKSAVAVITAPYFRRSPIPELKRRVSSTVNFFRKHAISSHRIQVRRIYLGVSTDSPEEAPRYPDITVVGGN